MQDQLEAMKKEKSELLIGLGNIKDMVKESQEKSGAMYVYARAYLMMC